MQKILDMRLNSHISKPVFRLKVSDDTEISCMFDTGSDTPVWCSGIEYFIALFPNSYAVDPQFLLGGFGQGVSEVPIYIVPEFRIEKIVFKNFHVAIDVKRRFSWDLVLSYTMFSKMDYSILNTVENAPILRFMYERDIYGTGIVPYDRNPQYADRIFSFVED